ncbi:MAG: glycosyltransferase [Chloroflexota bacterium]
MRPIRDALISEHANPLTLLGGQDAGGQNVYIDEVSRGLGELGCAVDIFTRCGAPEAPDVVKYGPGVRVINVKVGPPRFLLKDDLWPLMPSFCKAILHFAASESLRYDIIHGNFWMSGWVAAQLRRSLNIPAVQIFHAMGLTKRRHQGHADTSPEERIEVERYIVRQLDRFIAQCPAEKEELVQGYDAPTRRIALIPSAVNVERFRPLPRQAARALLGLPSDDFIVTYVGRMVRRKDVRNVVRAVARLMERQRDDAALPAVRLLIVGGETAEPARSTTPEIGALQDLGQELGIADRLIFTGARPPEELYRYYCAGNVSVSTPWYEPFGLTPLEAMACGRPVIGSAVGGIAYTIQDEVTGYHVPPRDPEALADRLQCLMSNDSLQRQMGHAARRRVEQEFTWPTVARRTLALYQAAVAERRLELPLRPRVQAPPVFGGAIGGSGGSD